MKANCSSHTQNITGRLHYLVGFPPDDKVLKVGCVGGVRVVNSCRYNGSSLECDWVRGPYLRLQEQVPLRVDEEVHTNVGPGQGEASDKKCNDDEVRKDGCEVDDLQPNCACVGYLSM